MIINLVSNHHLYIFVCPGASSAAPELARRRPRIGFFDANQAHNKQDETRTQGGQDVGHNNGRFHPVLAALLHMVRVVDHLRSCMQRAQDRGRHRLLDRLLKLSDESDYIRLLQQGVQGGVQRDPEEYILLLSAPPVPGGPPL